MQIDIIVLPQQKSKLIETWRLGADEKGKLYTSEGGRRIDSKKVWEEWAIKINQAACEPRIEQALDKSHTPVDVFLYLRDFLPLWLDNLGILKEAMEEARDNTWGGNLYLAWDRLSFNDLWSRSETRFEEWFQSLVQAGITDLIEITPEKSGAQDRGASEIDMQTFGRRVSKAKERRKVLREFINSSGWGVVMRTDTPSPKPLARFIKRLVKTDLVSPDSRNHVIFFDREPKNGFIELIDQSRILSPDGHRFVAALALPTHKLDRLEYQCRRKEPPLEIVHFNGAFEWLYALVRLNQAGRVSHLALTADNEKDYVDLGENSEVKRFHSEPNKGPLRLLVTSAFDPDDPEDFHAETHCLAATREIGVLARNLAFHIDVEVYPYMECEQLPTVLKGKQFTAWLHLSHGKRKQGLRDGRSGEYASLERWLNCFNAYKGSLQLVLLSACESAAIARRFAAAGARVAIGFENVVLTQATRIFTEEVIPVALQPGDRQAAVMAAFERACEILSTYSYLHRGEEKAYIDAQPRAYRARIKSS